MKNEPHDDGLTKYKNMWNEFKMYIVRSMAHDQV